MAGSTPSRVGYRDRINRMLREVPVSQAGDFPSNSALESQWAKYVCVLISGYLEQSVKEILLEHTAGRSPTRALNYIRTSWPISKNMNCAAIEEILGNFDEAWSAAFKQWLSEGEERKKEINEIVVWRNFIAHGKESATTNVTLGSVSKKFRISRDLVDFIELTCNA